MIRVHEQTQLTNAQARKTTLLVAAVLFIIAAWNLYRGRMALVAVLGCISGALVLMGLFLPALARRFHFHWMRLAVALGYVNSRILLTVFFYGVFAPYGLVFRLCGRDPLKRRDRKRESYWTKRKHTRQPREQFERLF